MKRSRKIGIGIAAGLVGVVLVAPLLIPISAWRAPLEEAASNALGAPVRIGDLSVFLLPLPHVTARDVEVGAAALRLQSVAIYPQVSSLLSSPRHLRSVELGKLDISPAGIELLQKFAEKPAAVPPPVTVGSVRAKGLTIELASGALPGLDAVAEIGPDNLPRSLHLATADGKARLTLDADGTAWNLGFEASDWQLPLGPPLKFATLKASGRVDRVKLVLPTITAALYGGQVTASADLDWQKGLKLGGHASVSALDIAPLLQALKLKASLSGRLDASGPFRAQAARPAALAEGFNAEVAFKVNDGVLHGFDLANAAKTLIKSGAAGGQTRFDQLSGNLQVAGRALRLRNVKVVSGVLDAKANVDVSPAKALSGRVEVDLKGTGGLIGVPLALSGTLADPTLMPTRGALAGAAIGTILLPGVGTSVGSSVGDKLGRLFGK